MLNLRETVQALNAQLIGDGELTFDRVTTDSRDIRAGDLFVALKGDRFDAHDFVAAALAQGAVAALVQEGSAVAQGAIGNLIVVADTLAALGELAKYWRAKHAAIPLVGVTGSNGKTSVKEMLASIFAVAAGGEPTDSSESLVHATKGNLNNHIGLPLTVLGMNASHRYVVAEMGMNHFGEIDYLTHIAQPDVALVNNAGAAHLEALGSVAGVARAKGEIFAGLVANGTAIINADDEFAPLWRELAAKNQIATFGLNGEVSAKNIELLPTGSAFTLVCPQGEAAISLAVPGEHNVRNALAAAAAAMAAGVSLAQVAQGLSQWAGVKGRLQAKTAFNGAAILDDTYNANPDSMKAAIDVLAAIAQGGKPTVLVLGDMGEVGADANERHAEIGGYAREKQIQHFVAVGTHMQYAVDAFNRDHAGAQLCADHAAAISAVRALLTPETQVLVKGSRFMRMETVVAGLENKTEQGAQPCC
ncbi:UDP-N-acetylmuramoyl-tripeptide--D-alanyl-D-alanine ligase [Chitinibacter bivalviorum]|uniref:UDP-N-acetylmuramoyl-tripeptide--D-alanyl-D-alanine ligase n=2 Tax=Chitinibacter bivalviorum TaxID=2739434 RepID=A0A7H9BN99_9NEIS|nr:UDP-N-acetylmuramoyl-tripeptide--D-alanyl-D-alanine ligase [Chitinibacter bivalviorum]